MARPRIFLSSTYFDLRSMRASLERFIKEMGYEPILFERGHVPYFKEDALENACYKEVDTCDILVAVIGGKIGTNSKSNELSITQNEINQAFEKGKQVYIFIEKSVHSEYFTYQKNKHLSGFSAISVDDVKIFDYVERIYALDVGNPVESFETVEDIIRFLREQWAGLFQRLMMMNSRINEGQMIESLKSSTQTLDKLVALLINKNDSTSAVDDILMLHHPAFDAIKKVASITYRVLFYNIDELSKLLSARGYVYSSDSSPEGYLDFDNDKADKYIRIHESIFDADGKLKVMTAAQWKESYIRLYKFQESSSDS